MTRPDSPGSLEGELREAAAEFGFFQAVRLLRLWAREDGTEGREGFATEPVRFTVNPLLTFPPGEINRIDWSTDPPEMEVNFFGLVGPQGVLPYEYSVHVTDRLHRRPPDRALKAFLDIFHHRAISLFYRAWEKYRFGVVLERQGEHALLRHVLDLMGAGTAPLRRTCPLPERAMASCGGILAQQPRTAAGLETTVSDYFGVPCRVEEFVGDWLRVEEWDLCRIGEDDGPQVELGIGSVLGDEFWDPHAKARLVLGPLDRSVYLCFLPGGAHHSTLREFLRFFTDDTLSWEVQLILAPEPDRIFGVRLGGEPDQMLGWSTWIQCRAPLEPIADTVLTL